MLKFKAAAFISCCLVITGFFSLVSLKPDRADYEINSLKRCKYVNYFSTKNSKPETKTTATAKQKIKVEEALRKEIDSFLTVKKGQTLYSIFRAKNIAEKEIFHLGKALKPFLRAKDLAVGDQYRFEILSLANKKSIINSLVIKKLDQKRMPNFYYIDRVDHDFLEPKFHIKKTQPKVIEKIGLIKLRVKNTLYDTFSRIPFGNELMQRLMGVLIWKLRMPQEVLDGDSIEILVTKRYALKKLIGYGRLETVFYRQKHRTLFATFFASKDNKLSGFFDEHGGSLEKEFLFAPVDQAIKTSRQKWRIHPIKKKRIRHNGVDYRGNGDDFFSMADGEVIEVGFDRNVGNMIRIKHKYGIYSEYFHAERIADDLKVGLGVKRGQKLGVIGDTGFLCTGPHLHMGLYKETGKRRRYINILSLKRILKSQPDIKSLYEQEFGAHLKNTLAMIKQQRVLALKNKGKEKPLADRFTKKEDKHVPKIFDK